MANPWQGVFQAAKTEVDNKIAGRLIRQYEHAYGRVRTPVEARIAWNRMVLTPEGRKLVDVVLDWWNDQRTRVG